MYFDDMTSHTTGGTTYQSMLGHWNAVVLTPIPEAETYAMMLTGLGLLGLMAIRRKSLEKAA